MGVGLCVVKTALGVQIPKEVKCMISYIVHRGILGLLQNNLDARYPVIGRVQMEFAHTEWTTKCLWGVMHYAG
jgi:hypothetical protein